MKAFKIKFVLITLLSMMMYQDSYALIPSADSVLTDCIRTVEINPYELIMASTEDLRLIVEQNKKREDLMSAKITYGGLGLGVGKADIFLTTKEGKIVDLNIVADVGILGFKDVIRQKITLDQILLGEPLVFAMNGASSGVLYVQPSADMNEDGGSATLSIWNGKEFKNEVITIKKDKGRFIAVKGNHKSKKKINNLKINMGGLSLPNMYVRNYQIKTN